MSRLSEMKTPSLPNFSSYHSTLDPKSSPIVPPVFEFSRIEDDEVETDRHTKKVAPSLSQQPSIGSSMNDHYNISVIDMYGDNTDGTSPVKVSQKSSINQEHQHNTSQEESNDDLIVSRENASRIRNSIESSNPSVKSSTDRYGFKKSSNFISESQYNNWWISYSSHCQRRKIKWTQLLIKSGLSLNNDNPQRFPPKSEKLKRYIRKGIPAEWRGNAWWYFAKGSTYFQQGVFDQLVESTTNLNNKDSEIIERDLHRTFPDNIHFKNNPTTGEESPLISSLRRVLRAFAVYQPSIGYCQSLNFICGLLLIFMDEERSFWMLVIITTKYLPGVHDINLEGVNIDQGVLMLSLRNFLPEVWDKISSIDFESITPGNHQHRLKKNRESQDFLLKLPPITLCTSSWFMSCFIGTLPIETTLRIWDCFLFEDSNFLFKISLSIFKLLESQIISLQDEMEIFQLVQNSPKSLIDPSSVFDIIFKKKFGFNNLNQDEINRCKRYVAEQRQRGKKSTSKLNHRNISEDELLNNRSLLDESLWQPDLYGFKKNALPGVHWNKSLTRKMRNSIKRRPTKESGT